MQETSQWRLSAPNKKNEKRQRYSGYDNLQGVFRGKGWQKKHAKTVGSIILNQKGDEMVNNIECNCVNPNACDCLSGGNNVSLQSELREFHERIIIEDEAILQINQPSVVNLASSGKRGAYF